jgi:hypothetical protein
MYDLQNNGLDSTRSRGGAKIKFDNQNKLWIGYKINTDKPGGIARFDRTLWEYEDYDTLQFTDVQSLQIDPIGNIWVSAIVNQNNNSFPTVYVKKNNIWHEYTDVDRLNTLTFDRSGNMWAIRAGKEIVKVSNAYTVGIEEEKVIAGNTEISLYPNPVRDYIDIRSSLEKGGNITIQVNTILGKTIIEHTDYNEGGIMICRLPLENISSGVYFVTVRSEGQSFTRMFVKE